MGDRVQDDITHVIKTEGLPGLYRHAIVGPACLCGYCYCCKCFSRIIRYKDWESRSLWRVGYLKKDREERYTSKHSWFVNAWRIVDRSGKDIVQPWGATKKEARETAKSIKLWLIEFETE